MFSRRIHQSLRATFAALAVSTALAGAFTRAFAKEYVEEHVMTVIAHAASGPLQCEIRRTETAGAVSLTGFIASSRATKGSFRFTVTKSGASGASNLHQGNAFDLAADRESQVGAVTINLDGDARVVVELSVESDDGLRCQASAAIKP